MTVCKLRRTRSEHRSEPPSGRAEAGRADRAQIAVRRPRALRVPDDGNLEEPWRRTALGFDSEDHLLDLRIEPSGEWRWLDEDDLEKAREVGLFSDQDAAAIGDEGERVLADWPFPTGWEDWRPDPRWPPGRLPEGWDVVEQAGIQAD